MTARRVLPHALDAEASVLGGILLRNDILNTLDSLSSEDFYDPRHRVIFSAMAELHSELVAIDQVTLEVELQRQGKLDAVGGVAFLGELALRVPTPDNVTHYAKIVATKARIRRIMLAASEVVERGYQEDLDEEAFAEEAEKRIGAVTAPAKPKRSPLISAADMGEHIRIQAALPIVNIQLGETILEAVPSGEACYLLGNSGGGKTTTALGIALSHARHQGPAVVASFELPPGIIGSRTAGIVSDTAWLDVLRNSERSEVAIAALAAVPRLYFLDSNETGMRDLEQSVLELEHRYPGQPILVICDYLQIIEAEERKTGADSPRISVTAVIKELRRLRRRHRLVTQLVLSQMSRANASATRNGEKIGRETSDTGAETGAIEQDAALIFAIGKTGSLQSDGSRFVDLNVGKHRFGGGDRVIVLKQYPASGLTLVYSDMPADEVRERAKLERERETTDKTSRAIIDAAELSPHPMTREDLCTLAKVQKAKGRSAIAALLISGEIVEVAERRSRASAYMVWGRERAASSGTALRPREAA